LHYYAFVFCITIKEHQIVQYNALFVALTIINIIFVQKRAIKCTLKN
jgi:hypothetical protein